MNTAIAQFQSKWMKMVYLTALIVAISPALNATGQTEGKLKSDRWQGMILDESTPEDAIKAFGTPSRDSLMRLPVSGTYLQLLTPRIKEDAFRTLAYSKDGKSYDVVLSFLDDKLVSILLPPKDISAPDLFASYGLDFRARIDGADQAFGPKDSPVVYYVYATAPRAFVIAVVANRDTDRSSNVAKAQNDYPGKIMNIQLVSRKLEDRAGLGAQR